MSLKSIAIPSSVSTQGIFSTSRGSTAAPQIDFSTLPSHANGGISYREFTASIACRIVTFFPFHILRTHHVYAPQTTRAQATLRDSMTAFATVPSAERMISNGLRSGAMTGDFVRMKSISSRAAVVARSPRKAISTVLNAGMFNGTDDSILAIMLNAEPA